MDESVNLRPRAAAENGQVARDPVVDIGALVSQLRLGALSGPVRVKGTSVACEVWKRNSYYCFGSLAEGKTRLRYRVPSTSMPKHGEDVVIVGTLVLSPLNFELQLHGDVESAWQPKHRLPRPIIPSRSGSPETLAQHLEQHAVTSLGFIATEIGWADIERTAGKATVANCRPEFANFSDAEDVIAAINRLCQNDRIKAIVIARGGGPLLDEIGNSDELAIALINRKLPFYTALGHSNDLMLLDKYADESFGAPSDFGHRLRNALSEIESNQEIRQKAEELDDENEQLKGAVSQGERALGDAKGREQLLRQQLDTATKSVTDQGKMVKWMIGGLAGLGVVVVMLTAIILMH